MNRPSLVCSFILKSTLTHCIHFCFATFACYNVSEARLVRSWVQICKCNFPIIVMYAVLWNVCVVVVQIFWLKETAITAPVRLRVTSPATIKSCPSSRSPAKHQSNTSPRNTANLRNTLRACTHLLFRYVRDKLFVVYRSTLWVFWTFDHLFTSYYSL